MEVKVKQVAALVPGDVIKMKSGKIETVKSIAASTEDARVAIITTNKGVYPAVSASYIVP